MERSFFQAAIMSILLYGCTTRMLTKRTEKKLDGNYIRMLRATLNKSWRQHPIKQQLYGHLPPITKTIKIRRTRHAGHCWRSRDDFISDVFLWTPHKNEQRQDVLLEPTYSSSVPILDVALRICRKQWTIERYGEKGSGISVLIARHDNDVYFFEKRWTCNQWFLLPFSFAKFTLYIEWASYICAFWENN